MKVLGWIIALPLMALALFAAARFVMCRPDGEVVRVATPMVEKIADYIVEHGVPESLEDIPGLPYELEGCSKTLHYRKYNQLTYSYVDSTENDYDHFIYDETCYFYFKKRFNVDVWINFDEKSNKTEGKVEVSSNHTYVGAGIKSDNFGKRYQSGLGNKAIYKSGFCAPLKQ